MQIPTYTPGLFPTAIAERATPLPLAAGMATPDRQPGRQAARPPVERVIVGEVLPRPMVADQLLTTLQATPLSVTPASPGVAAESPATPAATAKTLFYLLHSSTEQLGASPLGRRVDQLV